MRDSQSGVAPRARTLDAGRQPALVAARTPRERAQPLVAQEEQLHHDLARSPSLSVSLSLFLYLFRGHINYFFIGLVFFVESTRK